MSIKTLIQTRWKIRPQRIILYPYGAIYILSVFVTVFFISFFIFVYKEILTPADFVSLLPIWFIYLAILVFFWVFPLTKIIFNNLNCTMYKKYFGFIIVYRVKYEQIAAIAIVRNTRGTYQYRVFSKPNKYSRGIIISSAFGKPDSPHAIDFKDHVMPVIEPYLPNAVKSIKVMP